MVARFLLCFFVIYVLDRGFIGMAAENAMPDWASETYRVVAYPIKQLRKLWPEVEQDHGD